MPTQKSQSGSGPYWNRGFSPLFRGPYSDQHLRVSDAERQAVTDRLAEHFGDGRLDQAEFDERVDRAMNAKTRADLAGLFDDLPETGAPAGPNGHGAGVCHPFLLFFFFFFFFLFFFLFFLLFLLFFTISLLPLIYPSFLYFYYLHPPASTRRSSGSPSWS